MGTGAAFAAAPVSLLPRDASGVGPLTVRGLGRAQQVAQDRLEDAAVAVVAHLQRRVQARARGEGDRAAVVAPGAHLDALAGAHAAGDPGNVVGLVPVQPEALRALALRALERQDAHEAQV